MTVRRARALLASVALAAAAHAALASPAGAAAANGPTVLLDRTRLEPGQRVSVTFAGWRASTVNLSV